MDHDEIDMRVRAWAAQRRLPRAHLERWLSRAADVRKILLELAEALSLRTGQFLTVYELIDEIGVREKLGVREVLAMPAVAQLISGKGSGPGRAGQLIAVLRSLRYPRLHQAQAAASARLKALRLPPNIHVSWSPDMSGALKIELIADGSEQMAAALDTITAHRTALCALADEIG